MSAVGILRRCADAASRHVRLWRWAGNWATVRQLCRPRPGVQTIVARFAGRRFTLQVRGDTMDAQLARQILCEDSEYRVPVPIQPRVIFDVGANIGMTALYYATAYPEAHIYCFEPLPENIELLKANTSCYADRITLIPKGLADREMMLSFHPSDDPANFGGGSFHQVGCVSRRTVALPVTTVADVCSQFGIERVDLFKLDAEGAELSVLGGTPPQVLAAASVLIGELHGVDDWEFLQRLDKTHDVGVQKTYNRRCYPFVAVQRAAARQGGYAKAG